MSAALIEPADPKDSAALAGLRAALWPGAAEETPRNEGIVLLARDHARRVIGFAEASIRRDHVNGCDTSPVAFLEGLYVEPAHRRRGIARALVEGIAGWARARGFTELASDAPLENADSRAVHSRSGFTETEQVVFFRRAL